MAGWIKIYRSLEDHWLNENPEYLGWWVQLLLMASWDNKQVFHDSHLFILKRGQCIVSVPALMKKWGKSKPTIINFLKRLESDGMITRKVMGRQTPILTICNYDKYQDKNEGGRLYPLNTQSVYPQVDKQTNDTNNCESIDLGGKTKNGFDGTFDPQVDPQVDPYKEYKELININNKREREKKEIEELKKEQLWLEAMAMRYNCSSTQEIIQWLDVFSLDVQCRDSRHSSMSDMKRHFCDWLRIQLENKNKEKVINHGNQGKFNQRRGSEVTASSAKDYEGSF
ncbi:MAG: hypothetical protein ACI358_01555 [Candidatus Limimorpha sp.]